MIESFVLGTFLLNVYAAGLVLARALCYRTRVYRPMLWNIWLSVLPILILGVGFIVGSLAMLVQVWVGAAVFAVVGLVWLLVLPNASYLITELNLSHRRDDDPVPLWYDIILVISLAMSGVLNTVLNVFLAHLMYATTRYGDAAGSLLKPDALIFVALLLLLLGFGMYLGRYLRLNSWDVKHPGQLFAKVVGHFAKREHAWSGFGFTLTYAVFLGIIYTVVAGTVIVGLELVEAARAVG